MFVQPIGDSLVLAKLAFEIYRNGYQVAKQAPEEFRRLLDELRYSRDMFWWIHQTTQEDDHELLREALLRCMNVLEQEFKPLVKKFEKLGSTDRNIFFKRVQFAVDKRSITTCRRSLSDAKDHLQLALAAHTAHTAHTFLSKSSKSKTPAPRLQAGKARGKVVPPAIEEDDSDAESFVTAASDEDDEDVGSEIENEYEKLGGLPGSFKSTFHQELNEIDARDFSRFSLTGSASEKVVATSSYGTKPWRGVVQNRESFAEGAPLEASDSSGSASLKESRPASITDSGYQSTTIKERESSSATDLQEAQASGSKTFTLRKRHLTRTLLQRAFHGPPELEETFEEEAKIPETDMNPEAWISCAVWWYLKSRTIWDILAVDISQKPLKRSASYWHTTVSIYQTQIDLMKCDFILRRMVLARLKIGDTLTEAHWKTIQDLSAGIREEEHRREFKAKNLDYDDVEEHNFGFAEDFSQPVENSDPTPDGISVPQALDNLDPPETWLTVEQDHAGYRRKEVIFRSFVNAEIGNKDVGRRSPSAPYLLILSSARGSSDLTVSLINQRGTVSLSRNMIPEDIEDFDQDIDSDTMFSFAFPSQEAIIQFLSREDIEKFLERPRKFFAATIERDPKEGEFLVFREKLELLDDLKPDIFQKQAVLDEKKRRKVSENAVPLRRSCSHCEISLYEMVPDDCWKTTRRLVICSSPHELEPWCVTFWMPLSDVSVDLAEQHAKIAWSDFKNHEQKAGGDYWHIHSFTYQPKSPNREVWLTFHTSNAAEAFASCILNPFHTPFEMQEHVMKLDEFVSPSDDREIILYQMRNLNAGEVCYHSIVTIDKGANAQFRSQVFFVFRDLDFEFETETKIAVEIANLAVPHYISTMTDLNEFPGLDDGGPELKRIHHTWRMASFEFDDLEELEGFIKLLTGWYLQLHCRARSLQISYGLFDSKILKDLTICLWERAADSQKSTGNSNLHLTARSSHSNEVWWTTSKIDRNSGIDKHQGRDIVVGKIDVQFGTKVDCLEMEATLPSKCQQHNSRKGKVSIYFEDESCCRQFVQLLTKPFDDWLSRPNQLSKKTTQISLSSNEWPPPQHTATQETQISPHSTRFQRRGTTASYDHPPDWSPPLSRRPTIDILDPPPGWQPGRRGTQDTYDQPPSEWKLRRRTTQGSVESPPLDRKPKRRTTQDSLDPPPGWKPGRRGTQDSMDPFDPTPLSRRSTKESLSSAEGPPKRRGTGDSAGSSSWNRRASTNRNFDSNSKFTPRSTNNSFDGSLPPMYEHD